MTGAAQSLRCLLHWHTWDSHSSHIWRAISLLKIGPVTGGRDLGGRDLVQHFEQLICSLKNKVI